MLSTLQVNVIVFFSFWKHNWRNSVLKLTSIAPSSMWFTSIYVKVRVFKGNLTGRLPRPVLCIISRSRYWRKIWLDKIRSKATPRFHWPRIRSPRPFPTSWGRRHSTLAFQITVCAHNLSTLYENAGFSL